MSVRLQTLELAVEPETGAASVEGTSGLSKRLGDWFADVPSVIVAYSGGVDSALVLAAAHRAIGGRAVGCIAVSPSYPDRELAAAIGTARKMGAAYRIVRTEEHVDPRYAANPSNRCYFCKSELYDRLSQIAATAPGTLLVDGTNASDLKEHRPGYAAARERGVRSPLAELGIGKSQVREIARAMGLEVWDKPAAPCLASRVPTGVPIVPAMLRQIEQAEDVLVRLGFCQYRVRHHGDVARVELPPEDLQKAIGCREEIVTGIRTAGYRFVALDLMGFQSGSLHGLQS